MTKPQGAIRSRLKNTTMPSPRGAEAVVKFILYMQPADLLSVMEAIAATSAEDLKGIGKAGSQNGRAVAAICKAWMKARTK